MANNYEGAHDILSAEFLRDAGDLDNRIRQRKLDRRWFLEPFSRTPICVKAVGAGAATGTAQDVNLLNTGHNLFEYAILGTQTIVAPTETAVGLDIGSLDQTANDGLEICPGILANNPFSYVVGQEAFYLKLRFKIEDVSGTDDCLVGFRKQAAYAANVDDYTDAAFLNMISGDIKIETILNNAATVTTDTTLNWADGETHTLEVYVSAGGVATYMIDGAAPTVTAAYTFTAGLRVAPFVYFLQDTDIAGKVELISWECGTV